MNLDIRTAVQTGFYLSLIGIVVSAIFGIQACNKADSAYEEKRDSVHTSKPASLIRPYITLTYKWLDFQDIFWLLPDSCYYKSLVVYLIRLLKKVFVT